ncbi:cyclic AMP-dependent transcription factor ATF-2 [Aphidius gifuensis]|uniref:cyclic AMP-dependent transcription factor ATF-2 n=1 Tax=Aphidius gifuensis TaxID=684658 RepID=UPI001CDB7D52|nr:cyclic AMP-dependent transcription factor ATF-2 [Aphidius gifuensis]
MNHTEKPFGCNFLGCNMSFTNEDHLVVHKTKHNMMLNLGNGKPPSFIDQTPTPTRFMRSSEEVGLFQDLQHVNPFDETFRKAVECGKLESLEVTDINDDTLNTPQVFPNLDDEKIMISSVTVNETTKYNNNNVREENKNSIIITTESTMLEKNTEAIQEEENLPATSSFDNDQELVDEQLDDPQKFKTTGLLENYTNDKSNDILWSHSSTKTQLQVVDKSNNYYYKNTEENENYSREISASLNVTNNKPNDVKKKLDILERNRASSMRSRAKRKAWIEQLETSMEKVNSVNKSLQNEVNALRFEVANLKTLLLAHKNCPVTKALTENKPETSKIIPIITQQISTPITIINPSIENSKKIILTNQSTINSKRKLKPKISQIKSQILLPKINNSGLSSSKIIRQQSLNNFQQVISEKTTSQKLFVIKK